VPKPAPTHHAGRAAACGRYAALQSAKVEKAAAMRPATPMPWQDYDAATAYLSDTLDWLNLWDDNDTYLNSADDALDGGFNTQQNHDFPQP
jgi:hypothetical protein